MDFSPVAIARARELAERAGLTATFVEADTQQDLDTIRREMDTHFYGSLNLIRAFAPQLDDGAILNVLSAISWLAYDGAGAYHAAKAAEWALTNNVRLELAHQRTLVTGLHLGAADTDLLEPPGEGMAGGGPERHLPGSGGRPHRLTC
ncbi:SDR family NAD(P)-dependent oxidoreductase [Nonomuraea sp. 10N515B]|uniref:SDR family NAD(P)-dependent oxidoreductase n=1 Tax=Nonomuraea sp. 10N515B TaxID=3457422 RepID=UPI003FCE2866